MLACVKARSDIARRLGTKVAQLRLGLNLGQKELSKDAGTSDKTISQLERGVSVPRIEKLAKIAEVLHTTLSDLFESTEEVSDQRRKALDQINYILRGRSAVELKDVLEILRRVFKIKRRERPEPPPAKRPRRRRQ